MNNLKNIIMELKQEIDWWNAVSSQESKDEDVIYDQTMAKGIYKAIERLGAWQKELKDKLIQSRHLFNTSAADKTIHFGFLQQINMLKEFLGED